MKNKWILLCAATSLFCLSLIGAEPTPTSAEQLRTQCEAALKAKDSERLTALVYWTDASDRIKGFQLKNMTNMLRAEVQSVKLAPAPPNFPGTRERDGIRFSPNMTIIGVIEVSFAKKDDVSISAKLPYGKAGEKFYLASTKEEEIPASPAK